MGINGGREFVGNCQNKLAFVLWNICWYSDMTFKIVSCAFSFKYARLINIIHSKHRNEANPYNWFFRPTFLGYFSQLISFEMLLILTFQLFFWGGELSQSGGLFLILKIWLLHSFTKLFTFTFIYVFFSLKTIEKKNKTIRYPNTSWGWDFYLLVFTARTFNSNN